MRRPKPMLPDTAERYKRAQAALRSSGITAATLAKRIKKQRQHVSLVITGQTPGTVLWPRIAKTLNVELQWLLHGSGRAPAWAEDSGDFAGAIASLEAAAAIVRRVALVRNINAKHAMEAIEHTLKVVSNLR